MVDLLVSLIASGREERNLEYKQSMSWADAKTKAKVAKSSLAMSNLRDGGTILFGLERQSDDTYLAAGMAENDYDSFNQDDVSVEVNNYADPFVELIVLKQVVGGRRFVALVVREFEELPTVCKRDGLEKLRRGAIYIRPRRKFETVEVPSHAEMREILDLAMEKRVRALYSQVERLGAQLTFPPDEDVQRFAEQLGDL